MPVFQNVPNQRKNGKDTNPASCRRKQFVEVETLPKDAPLMRSRQLILGPLRLVFPAFPPCVCYKYFLRAAQQKCSAILLRYWSWNRSPVELAGYLNLNKKSPPCKLHISPLTRTVLGRNDKSLGMWLLRRSAKV